MAATRTGHGYWLVASDGGIFSVRRRGVPRLDRRHQAEGSDRRHRGDTERERLLARRVRRRRLRVRRRRVPRLDGRDEAEPTRRGHGSRLMHTNVPRKVRATSESVTPGATVSAVQYSSKSPELLDRGGIVIPQRGIEGTPAASSAVDGVSRSRCREHGGHVRVRPRAEPSPIRTRTPAITVVVCTETKVAATPTTYVATAPASSSTTGGSIPRRRQDGACKASRSRSATSSANRCPSHA